MHYLVGINSSWLGSALSTYHLSDKSHRWTQVLHWDTSNSCMHACRQLDLLTACGYYNAISPITYVGLSHVTPGDKTVLSTKQPMTGTFYLMIQDKNISDILSSKRHIRSIL